MKIYLTDWAIGDVSIRIPELDFYKKFKYEVEAREFIENHFKNYEIENVVYP